MRKKRKYFYILTIFIGVVFGIIMFTLESTTASLITYNATATIIERRSAKMMSAKLNDDAEAKVEESLEIQTNIFGVNDKIKVEYFQDKYKVIVNKVEAIIGNNNDKTKLIQRIEKDPIMIRYLEKISGSTSNEEFIFSPILALPYKINSQEFVLLSSEDYYNTKNLSANVIPEGEKIKLVGTESFNVLNVENILEENSKILNYTYENNYDKNTIIFSSTGSGIYSVKLEFKNKDIINYIFR